MGLVVSAERHERAFRTISGGKWSDKLPESWEPAPSGKGGPELVITKVLTCRGGPPTA